MRTLTIDWNGLHSAFQMNMPEVRCFLSLIDGHVLKLPPGEPRLAMVRSEPHNYLPIEAVPSRIQYQWVDEFVAEIQEPGLKARLEAAINGKGAFRRFKDILLTLPDERRRWFEFRDQMMRKRIVDWVMEQGIVAVNQPPWLADGKLPEHGAVPEEAPSMNSRQDMEALRDFFIAWGDSHEVGSLSPILWEELAQDVGRRFYLRSTA